MFEKILLLLIIAFVFCVTRAEEKNEITCSINGKRAINCVSEKFLSISIDPAVLLAGVNLSESSLKLANHLAPAYIRIAGPSTDFVKYVDADFKLLPNDIGDDGSSVVITPSMWFGINEWLRLAGLTPIFGINDKDTSREVWNPKSVLPLLEITEKLNVSCYWQLGYDPHNKSEVRYKQDLSIFQLILAAFPQKNETWKIVGSDISNLPMDQIDSTMEDLRNITSAVMWEPEDMTEESFPDRDRAIKILQTTKPKMKIWTSIPRSSESPTFQSALLWAKQIGQAANIGFDVVFRQPRIYEFFHDTPIYWFSLLHKKLMGSNVLEAKTTIFHQGTSVYAHCTRKQNSFVRRGAMTIMIVNDNEETYNIKIKLGITPPDKTMEVQSYIMTSTSLNSSETFVNGELLTSEVLSRKDPFEPKLRRAKTSSHIALSVPPYSIGFFVLPGARVPVCIEQENEIDLLLEEIEEDQNGALSEELALQFGTRGGFSRNQILEEITRQMKQEMNDDGKYYHNFLGSQIAGLKERLKDEPKGNEGVIVKGRKFFIERAKLAEKRKKNIDLEKKKEELRKFLLEKSKFKPQPKIETKAKDLDLSSLEVEKILKERAQARAAQRNIVFTDEELDALIHKASKKFYKTKIKREINMDLLRRKLYQENSHQNGGVLDNNKVFFKTYKKRSKTNRTPRDVNAKILELKSKLAEKRQRMEDKKLDILGNARTVKDNFEDKIRQFKANRRFRRDINLDLLKTKTEGKKMKMESEVEVINAKPAKHAEKEATIRLPGQSSDEFFDEFELGETEEEKPKQRTEIIAELADSDYTDNDFFETTTKSSKLKLFDKKPKMDPFGVMNPSIEIVRPMKKNKKNKKKKPKSEDALQFLTSSEEFTDIEDDYPCIHEYFGTESDHKKDNTKGLHELGEISSEEKTKKGKSQKKKKQKKKYDSDEDYDYRRKRDVDGVQDDNFVQMNLNANVDKYSNLRQKRAKDKKKPVKSKKSDEKDEDDIKEFDDFESLLGGIGDDMDMEELIDEDYDFRRKRDEGSKKTKKPTKKSKDKNVSEDGEESDDLLSLLGGVAEDIDLDYLDDDALFLRRKRQNNEEDQGLNRFGRTKRQKSNDDIKNDVIDSSTSSIDKAEVNSMHGDESTVEGTVVGSLSEASHHEEDTLKKPTEEMMNRQLSAEIDLGVPFEGKPHNFGQARKKIVNKSRSTDTEAVPDKNEVIDETNNNEAVRLKREEEITHKIIQKNLADLKKDVRDQFEELKSLLVQDKLNFQKEKHRNKLKLSELHKGQEQLTNEANQLLGEVHRVNENNYNEMFQQLQSLKKKMEQKKSEVESLLKKGLNGNENILEKQQELMKDTVLKQKEFNADIGKDLFVKNDQSLDPLKLESRIKEASEKLLEAMKNAFQQPPKLQLKADINGIKDNIEINSKNLVKNDKQNLNKRSIIDHFKTDQPLNVNENNRFFDNSGWNEISKMFKVKRQQPNDAGVFKELAQRYPSKIKRSIDDSENEIDSNLNYIEKESKYKNTKPNIGTYYEHIQRPIGYDITTERTTTEIIEKLSSSNEKQANSSDVESGLKKHESSIQKIGDDDDRPKGLKAVFSSVTGFLADLGKKIENYVQHITSS